MNTNLTQLYDDQILPNIPYDIVLAAHKPVDKGDRYEIDCPECSQREAYIYKKTGVVGCNRKKNCAYEGNLLGLLNGGEQPKGDKYIEIIKQLCEATGIAFPEREFTSQEIEAFAARDRKQQLLQDFNVIITKLLPIGTALDYLSERGVSEDEATRRGFCFYPSKDFIKQRLTKLSYLPDEIHDSGIYRDDWTNRLIIPIKEREKCCDFVARDITGSVEASKKYLRMNKDKAPDGSALMGLDSAGKHIILVEGYPDQIMLAIHGIQNVVTLGGVNLTQAHIEKFKKYGVKSITLLLDNDNAGRNGIISIIKKYANEDIELYVIDPALLGESKDPDEFVRKNGSSSIATLLDGKEDAFRYVARDTIERHNKSGNWKDDERADVLKEALAFDKSVTNRNRLLSLDCFWNEFAVQTNFTAEVIEGCRQNIQEKKDHEAKKSLIEKCQAEVAELVSSGRFDNIGHRVSQLSENLKELDGDREQLKSLLLNNNTETMLIEEFRREIPSINTGYTVGSFELAYPAGGLTIIGGPTGHGKTSILINTTLGALARNKDLIVYYLTYEESWHHIQAKCINTYINLPLNNNNNRSAIFHYFNEVGKQGGKPYQYFNKNQKEFAARKNDFFSRFIATGRLKILRPDMFAKDLAAAIRFIKKNTAQPCLIVVDYVQLLSLEKPAGPTRHEELKEICSILADCAIDTGFSIVLGAQMNRKVTSEAELSIFEIGEAYNIAQYSSLFLGIWNRNLSTANPTSEIFAKVLKGRNIGSGHEAVYPFDGNTGKIGTVDFDMDEHGKNNTYHNHNNQGPRELAFK